MAHQRNVAKQGLVAANSETRQTGARDADELARRIATGAGVGSIARQGLKNCRQTIRITGWEEFIQESGEGYLLADAGSEARGDKGVLNSDDWKM